jgi:hypothetical protein
MKKCIVLILFFSFQVYAEYLFVEGGNRHASKWTKFSGDKRLNIKNLFQELARSTTGRTLLKKANQKAKSTGKNLYDVVDVGTGSLLDTTLIRKFDKHHFEQITYVTDSKVFINRELPQTDAVLDLAHELTHYVYRTGFNPYEKNFSLGEFIKSTIEGKGGEVQAFLVECKVQIELYGGKDKARHNCQKIIDENSGSLSRELAIKSFYQVGSYFESFKELLDKYNLSPQFPDLSSRKERFVSSAYGIPYPVAAFEEYLSVLSKACENDKRRIKMIKTELGRSPANLQKMETSYNQRCSDFIN